MVRIIILVVIGLVSFSVVFGLGYFFIVPRTDTPMMGEALPMGDMEPAGEESMESAPQGELEDPGKFKSDFAGATIRN